MGAAGKNQAGCNRKSQSFAHNQDLLSTRTELL
jgi:hypothetical protein